MTDSGIIRIGQTGPLRREGSTLDQQLKRLIDQLGEAINESLADSDKIAEIVGRIKEGGHDVFLVLQATIGVSQSSEGTPDKTSVVTTFSSSAGLNISEQDVKFLKSLRIKVEDDGS